MTEPIIQRMKVIKREEFYPFPVGDHEITFVSVRDKGEPFLQVMPDGRKRRVIRTIIEDENRKRWVWFIDVTDYWKEDHLEVDEWREARDAQVLLTAKEAEKLEGLKIKLNVREVRGRKSYSVKPIEVPLEKFEEVTVPPKVPEKVKIPKVIPKVDYERVMGDYTVVAKHMPHKEAIETVSEIHKISVEEVEKIVAKEKEKVVIKKEEKEIEGVASKVYELLNQYGPLNEKLLIDYIETKIDLKGYTAKEVIEYLKSSGKIEVKEGITIPIAK